MINQPSFVTDPSPGPLPDEVHRDSGPPSPLRSLCDNPSLRVIPRSRRRRGISHCLENTQSEIPRSARNDSLGRVITQTPGERTLHPLRTRRVQPKMWDILSTKGEGCISALGALRHFEDNLRLPRERLRRQNHTVRAQLSYGGRLQRLSVGRVNVNRQCCTLEFSH